MKKALIVDDEQSILVLISRALKDGDFEILTATQMVDAEFAIKNAHPELIIADLRLTGVLGQEGLELLAYVAEKSPGSKVIIMTGYGTPEIKSQAMALGAFDFFEKPVNLRELKSCVERAGMKFAKKKKKQS